MPAQAGAKPHAVASHTPMPREFPLDLRNFRADAPNAPDKYDCCRATSSLDWQRKASTLAGSTSSECLAPVDSPRKWAEDCRGSADPGTGESELRSGTLFTEPSG